MNRLLFLILSLFLFSSLTYSQSLDFISVKKKNGITVKHFMAGIPILYKTKNGKEVQGIIQQIKRDSIWVLSYNIQIVPTQLGVTMVDTTSAYVNKIFYKDIGSIYISKKGKYFPSLASKAMMVGSSGYIALNVINHLLDGDSPTEKKNLKRISTAVGIGAIGFLLHKIFDASGFSRKRHKIVYVHMP
jgi:hypothetical protein